MPLTHVYNEYKLKQQWLRGLQLIVPSLSEGPALGKSQYSPTTDGIAIVFVCTEGSLAISFKF